ncbi:class I SAM-dependent methyltransferase [Dactylosporangium sp. NPDC005572]|uniref:class I SAM-dependent methyltransferase n=1 Tax=Dactylosporangium sp. NPDC005572 TaxID=3156889 RepID=UPI0033A4FBB7
MNHFDGWRARWYSFLAGRLLRFVYRRLARDAAALAGPGAAVLDVGTGPGVLPDELARLRPDLTVAAVDPARAMVAAAGRRLTGHGGRARVTEGTAEALPFPDGSFDLVVSSLSLHHWADPAAAAPELVRVLRPGGRICLYDFPAAPFDAVLPAGAAVTRTELPWGIPHLGRLTRALIEPSS